MQQFHEYCPEGSDKYDVLRKHFEKINKNSRKPKTKVAKEGDDDDEEDEQEEEPEEEGEEEDEDENNEIAGLP